MGVGGRFLAISGEANVSGRALAVDWLILFAMQQILTMWLCILIVRRYLSIEMTSNRMNKKNKEIIKIIFK